MSGLSSIGSHGSPVVKPAPGPVSQASDAASTIKANIKRVEAQVDQLFDSIVDATGNSVVAAYEKRIAKLERE